MTQRSNPDEILKQIVKHSVGRHKIYLGMAPGVGKTYKMLEEALELKKKGIDIVIGYIELQDREDNKRLLNNFEKIPMKKVEIGNNNFYEFDLELVLERKPACVIVDELAHSNIPGSKNKKRYQDIEILLQNGVSVLSTLNVHQIASIAPLVEKNLNIQIKETVPDIIINNVDELIVIDMPIDELYRRLENGKIYKKDQLQHALSSFFKRNNLLMLRDMALNYLAERVDTEVINENLLAKIKERILVALTATEGAFNALEQAIEVSKSSHADIDVACFTGDMNEEKQNIINRLREKVKTIKGNFILIDSLKKDPFDLIYHHIKSNRTTLLVLSKHKVFSKTGLFKDKISLRLLEQLSGVDILIVGKNKPVKEIKQDKEIMPKSKNDFKYGHLKIIIGMAPGVGKTYRMLQEAHDLLKSGKKILLGVVDTHDRVDTAKQVEGLPILNPKIIEHQGKIFHEFDLEAAILEKPDLILVDELAHSNVPGSINNKRYQDVQYLLRAGIDVITTVNIQHIESLNDIVEQFSGIRVRETVPDWIISHANEIVLIDISPESLQERLKEGKVYSVDKIEQALTNFFQKKNLVALRELSLREVAENVEHELYPKNKHLKILSIIDINKNTLSLIRKSARIANRLQSDFIVAHIVKDAGKLIESRKLSIIELEELVVELGGDFRLVESNNELREIKSLEKKINPDYVIINEGFKKSDLPFRKKHFLNRLIKETNESHLWIIGSRKDTLTSERK